MLLLIVIVVAVVVVIIIVAILIVRTTAITYHMRTGIANLFPVFLPNEWIHNNCMFYFYVYQIPQLTVPWDWNTALTINPGWFGSDRCSNAQVQQYTNATIRARMDAVWIVGFGAGACVHELMHWRIAALAHCNRPIRRRPSVYWVRSRRTVACGSVRCGYTTPCT
jgi:hypothetical protein